MSLKIKLKHQFLILFFGIIISLLSILYFLFYLSGPRLSLHYDFLAGIKRNPPVSQQILIINTDKTIDNNEIFLVLMNLAQMGAEYLVITDSAASPSSSVLLNESELNNLFNEEFGLLGMNIRNLFSAIRTGAVTPEQAPVYIDHLVELAAQGKDRLLTAVLNKNDDLSRAFNVLEKYAEASYIPKPDYDGKYRRVLPVNSRTGQEHPVYSYLKNRFTESEITSINRSKYLILDDEENKSHKILLDKNNSIITFIKNDFRNIGISLFTEYEEKCRKMRETLVYGDSLGVFSVILPELSPLFLGDYSEILKEEALINPNSETRNAWIKSVNEYFKSLDDFISGPSQNTIIHGYNEVIEEEGLEALIKMRDELIVAFNLIRNLYGELKAVRDKLTEEVYASFCIMGDKKSAEYSALLANAIITGSHIKPLEERLALIISLIAVLVILCGVFLLSPVKELLIGFGITFLFALACCFVFLFYSYWYDPLIILGSGISGTLAVFFGKIIIFLNRKHLYSLAYRNAADKNVLKKLVNQGYPNPKHKTAALCCVAAVKDKNFYNIEANEKPDEAGNYRKNYYLYLKDTANKNGGIIAGLEGDTVLVCFGSSLDNTPYPEKKACSFIKEIAGNGKYSLHFGIDSGLCTFLMHKETGFSVYGKAAFRARILASRSIRLKACALITEKVRHKIDLNIEKKDSLFEDSEPVFELPSDYSVI